MRQTTRRRYKARQFIDFEVAGVPVCCFRILLLSSGNEAHELSEHSPNSESRKTGRVFNDRYKLLAARSEVAVLKQCQELRGVRVMSFTRREVKWSSFPCRLSALEKHRNRNHNPAFPASRCDPPLNSAMFGSAHYGMPLLSSETHIDRKPCNVCMEDCL